jgi:tRNA (adenine37-N6)-methyltransferase
VKTIGTFRAEAKFPYDVPRQGSLNKNQAVGIIELLPGNDFEQALSDLDGFERIWVIYEFHHNQNWKPKTTPPRGPNIKRGVFATRSPYRPNPIGLSCVKLLKVDGLRVFVQEYDLLDGSPVLDIKPYLPYADSFPDAKMGWAEDVDAQPWIISYGETAERQLHWLEANGLTTLGPAIVSQLEYEPIDQNRKRVIQTETGEFIFSYRTWRVHFALIPDEKRVLVEKIFSGYDETELHDGKDPYQDKAIHIAFRTNNNIVSS